MSNYTGNIYTTNSSGKLVITKYINHRNVEVRFIDTGYQATVRMDNIRRGGVKDPLYPSVYGVGFIGVGSYKVSTKGKVDKSYKAWHSMLERCYSEGVQNRYPTYIGCAICEEWRNYQLFAKWYYENYPDDGGKYELDKDILVDGNKVYSPETCLLVSHAENSVKANAKSYMLRSPDGVVTEVYNLSKFCRDNCLHRGRMSDVSSGKAKQHKGWSLA